MVKLVQLFCVSHYCILFCFRKYLYEQRTSHLEIPYYVKENFLADYKHRISQIERNVEEEYLVNVRTSCFRERNYSKYWLLFFWNLYWLQFLKKFTFLSLIYISQVAVQRILTLNFLSSFSSRRKYDISSKAFQGYNFGD